ncbi:MAG: peptidylprolyl isomerase, partial [bacterium]
MSDNIFQRIFQPSGRGKLWWIFTFIIILAIASFSVDFGGQYNKVIDKYNLKLPHAKQIDFRLGLDLQGGSQLIYQADVSAIPSEDRAMSVEGARDVIERRVNFFGVSEPNVQVNHTADGDYRILVELAGVSDVKEAIKKIGETPLLEFKEQNNNIPELNDEQKKEMGDYNNAAQAEANKVLKELQAGKSFESYNTDNAGWISETSDAATFAFIKDLEVGKISQKVEHDGDGFVIYKLNNKRIKEIDGQPAKEVKASHLLICYEGTSLCESGLTKKEAEEKIKKLKESATPDNFAELVKNNSTEPGAKDSYGDLGWFGAGAMVKPFEEAVFAQAVGSISDVVETDFGFHIIYKQEEREVEEYDVSRIFFDTRNIEDILGPRDEWKNTQLSGKNLKRSVIQFNPNDNTPEIGLEFDDEGAKLFEEITDRNVGKPVAIFLDGYPISIPNVNEKITGGKAVISGNFTLPEAKKLVKELNAGALPVPIKLINQQTIGASLGQKSVSDSLQAGLWGLILVALFMIIYYRLPGVLSVISLAIYGLVTLAI